MNKNARQIGALPWRLTERGLEIMLVTTRNTRRWVIPKGWPMKDRPDSAAAQTEALEEAGIEGDVSPLPFGTYNYSKILVGGKPSDLSVDVYPLTVTAELENWLEKHERERQWYPVEQAISIAGEAELAAVLVAFAEKVQHQKTLTETSQTHGFPYIRESLDVLMKSISQVLYRKAG